MTLLLKQFFTFIKLLNSDTGINQIAAGLAAGLILGFTPFLSLHCLILFALIFIFRIQLGACLVSAFFFKFIAFLFDPLFDKIGSYVLEINSLKPFFTSLYNMPIIPYTRFNNSIVMGSAVISFLLFPFMFMLFRYLVKKYRSTILETFQQTKFWKLIKATSFYKWYVKYDNLYGT